MKRILGIRRVSLTLALSVVLVSPVVAGNVDNLGASSEQLRGIEADSSLESARATAFIGHQTMMGEKAAIRVGVMDTKDYSAEDRMERSKRAARWVPEDRRGLKTGATPKPRSAKKRKRVKKEPKNARSGTIGTVVGAVIAGIAVVTVSGFGLFALLKPKDSDELSSASPR